MDRKKMDKQLEELFEQEMAAAQKQPITEVRLDALVALKIVNHCVEKLPTVPVSGTLLGLNVDGVLEVTDCFAVPPTSDFELEGGEQEDEGDSAAARKSQYQVDMMRYMVDANADNNAVGWYQSSLMESYNTVETIDNQYKHQLTSGQHCVCIVFDPLRSNNGHIEMRALRLTEQFMDAVRKVYLDAMEQRMKVAAEVASKTIGAKQQSMEEERQKLEDMRELQKVIPTAVMPKSIDEITITQELLMLSRFKNMQIFEELPVRINNRALVDAYMHDLVETNLVDDDINFDGLDLSSGPYLERELGGLVEASDDLLSDLREYANHQRRVARAKSSGKTEEQPHNRLNGVVIGKQMDNYVQHLNSIAAQGINKIYLAKAVMRQAD